MQLDRRHFLAAGASLLAVPAIAGTADEAEFSFALVTDTHLGKSAGYLPRLREAVKEINRSPAALTIFCGDLVDRGEDPERQKLYPEWLESAKELKKEWRAVPGNHDPVEMFRKHVAAETESVIDHKGYRFITFADAQPNPGHMGVVTAEQLKWLAGRIEEAGKKGQRVVLAAHVVHHENKHPDVGWYIKEGREELGKLLKANPHVVAFFGGHHHCGMRGWDDTPPHVHEVIVPCLSYNKDRKLGAAPGFAVGEFRPAWTQAGVYRDRIVLKYKPVGAEVAAEKVLKLA